jgi:hypothetical protein
MVATVQHNSGPGAGLEITKANKFEYTLSCPLPSPPCWALFPLLASVGLEINAQ